MENWKKAIFVKAIRVRLVEKEGSVEDIIKTYPKLSDEEVQEILQEFN